MTTATDSGSLHVSAGDISAGEAASIIDLADPAPRSGAYVLEHHDVGSTRERLLADLRHGLTQTPKTIPPKWFYDDEGSRLFELITRLPEYYPTEAERGLLLENAREIVELSGADTLVELGAGVSDKTTALLDAMAARGPLRFVPFDISADAIDTGVERLMQRYADIAVHGVVGDFDLHLDRLPTQGRRLVAFLGGTIGNYAPAPRAELLRSLISTMDADDHLLLGTDLVKDERRLVDAYDDSAGVTADFNRNVLAVMAREFDLDLDPSVFDHRAVWNAEEAWIEMHLVAREAVSFELPGLHVDIDRGEHLWTEISAKFTRERLMTELRDLGLEIVGWWTDGDFAVSLSRRA